MVRSPIQGVISYDKPLSVGDALHKGQLIAKVENHAVNDVLAMKQDVELKLQNARAQVTLLQASLGGRQAMYAQFNQRDRIQNDMMVKYTSQELNQAKAGYNEAVKNLENAQSRTKHYDWLAQKGYVSALQAQAEAGGLTSAEERANAKRAELQATSLQHQASRVGLQLTGSQTESSPRLQKQSLSKEVLDIRQSLAQYQSSIPLLERQLADMNQELSVLSAARINSPIDGILWATPVRDGEVVDRHDVVYKVVNCQESWVDAYLNESKAVRIDPAKPVKVKIGKSAEYVGKIRFIRTGVGKFSLDEGMPEGFDQIVKNKSLVRIAVKWPKLATSHGLSPACTVGQSAEVTFNAP